MPGQGVTARIDVLPRYRAELIGVELSSHLIVVGRFHEARRPLRDDRSTVRPAGIPPRGSFATRSPSRPNPISLTVVRVVARTELTLEVEGLDLVDGTAVLDLKPYIPGQDGVFSAIRSWRSRTSLGPHRLLGYLEPELRNHLGDLADLPAARAALGAVLLASQRLDVDPRDPALSARVNRADASADALMGLLGATLASGRVTIAPRRGPLSIRFMLGDRTLDLVQAGGRRDPRSEPGTWLERVS
jgi:tRNA-Thr(GGU) m(6)t(6)A37 methyltransferase TsaA